jgi:hypothetical protein
MLELRTLLIQKGEIELWLAVRISCALHSDTTYSRISGRTGSLLPQMSDLALPNLTLHELIDQLVSESFAVYRIQKSIRAS